MARFIYLKRRKALSSINFISLDIKLYHLTIIKTHSTARAKNTFQLKATRKSNTTCCLFCINSYLLIHYLLILLWGRVFRPQIIKHVLLWINCEGQLFRANFKYRLCNYVRLFIVFFHRFNIVKIRKKKSVTYRSVIFTCWPLKPVPITLLCSDVHQAKALFVIKKLDQKTHIKLNDF